MAQGHGRPYGGHLDLGAGAYVGFTEPPISRQMLRLIGKRFTVRTDKASKQLGYSPRVTWKEGIAEMITI
jgi:hypothetical protein